MANILILMAILTVVCVLGYGGYSLWDKLGEHNNWGERTSHKVIGDLLVFTFFGLSGWALAIYLKSGF